MPQGGERHKVNDVKHVTFWKHINKNISLVLNGNKCQSKEIGWLSAHLRNACHRSPNIEQY